ncbi:MAG TPA: hypothetical protein VK563_23165 [Puia sp.]|nr:hypothetical protein [Puia sp.]
MEKIDVAYQKFEKILDEISSYSDTIFSEQDSRIKIIDRILLEVLGFNYADISTEPKSGDGYIDYLIKFNNIPKFILEAKRDGLKFAIDESYSGRYFKLNGPVFKDPTIQAGIKQAIYYSAMEGVDLACLSNGRTWIIFRANRVAENKNVFDGKGFVFASLESLKKEFKLFYELLSPDGINSLKYKAIFQDVDGLKLRSKQDAHIIRDENHLSIMDRGKFSYEIDRVMNEFFSKLNGETDPNLLIKCFVETKESYAAEQKLKRLSEELITKIRTLETQEGALLQELIERVKTTQRHEFVLLVGGKGAGKSTFVERFFKISLSKKMRDQIILIRINVGESSGDINNIIGWLDQTVLEECETILFDGAPTYDQLVSIFFYEYKRLSEGSWRVLYESNKEQFKIEFGKHIEQRRETRPMEHIKRLIGDITKSRFKIPCIVFDNADHFGIDFQEKIFQYARSIYEREICLIIVPITDRTSWELSKQGAIQSFENEKLFLPTPAPSKIIEKRIEYLQEIITSDEQTKVKYFLGKGIKLEISNIEYFVKCLQQIFLKNPLILKWVGNLSNLDIRRCLDLTRDIIASPQLSFEELFATRFTGRHEEFPIKEYKVKNAIIKKTYTSYPTGHHSFVQNLFFAIDNLNSSPILSIRILQLLLDRKNQRNKEDDFLAIGTVIEYFGNMGIESMTTLNHMDFLLKKGLINSYDPTILDINQSKKVELSPSGHEHYAWGFYDDDYLFMMIEVTPITDQDLYNYISEYYYNWNYKNNIILHFLNFLEAEDKQFCIIPDHLSYSGQKQILNRYKWRKQRLERFISKSS